MICWRTSLTLVLPRICPGKNFNFLCHGSVRRFLVWFSLCSFALSPSKVVADFTTSDQQILANISHDTREMRGSIFNLRLNLGDSWGLVTHQYMETNYLTDRIWLDWQRDGLGLQSYGVSQFVPTLDVPFSNSSPVNTPKIQDALIALASLNPNQSLRTSNGYKEMLGFGQLFYGYSSNSYAAAHNSIHSNGIFYAVNDMARSLREIARTATNIAFYVSSPPYNYANPSYSNFVANQSSMLSNENIFGYGSSLDYLRSLLFDIPGEDWFWNLHDFAGLDEQAFMTDNFQSFLSSDYIEERLLHYYYYGNGNSPYMNNQAIELVNKYALEPEYIPTDLEYSNDVNKIIKNSTNKLVKYESVAPTDYDTSWVDEMQDFLNYDNNEIPGAEQDAPDLWEIIEGQGLLGYDFHFTPSVEGATPIDVACADFLNYADISPTLEKIKDFNTKLLKLAKYLMYFGFWIMLAFRIMHEIREFIG